MTLKLLSRAVASFALMASATLSIQAFAVEPLANPTHVVELFTSQGCSSCPPANKFVTKLAEDPNMLVLTYGVTYWDYLGWKDTFGDREFTQRQKDYRDAFGAANIYTPQIVLSGSAHSPRYSKSDVADMRLPEAEVDLTLTREGDVLKITAHDTPDNVILDLVSYIPGEQSVDVRRGENGGRTLELTNVVTGVQIINWDGKSAEIKMPASDSMAYAALLHDGTSAKILDAAVIR